MHSRRVAFTLGMVLPIDYVEGVNPVLLDVARYGLSAVLILGTRGRTRIRGHSIVPTVFLLLSFHAVFLVLSGLTSNSSQVTMKGSIALLSVVTAFFVAQQLSCNRALLGGFLVGISASALDLVSQAYGGPFLGPPSVYGIRFSGMSYSSTAISPLIALGLVLVITDWLWPRGRSVTWRVIMGMIRLAALGILVTGLVASGGRGGIAGFALALFLWLFGRGSPLSFERRIVALGAISFTLVLFRSMIAAVIFRPSQELGFTGGRNQFNLEAWRAFVRSPLLGVEPRIAEGLRPHSPLITFAVEMGIVGLAIASVLLLVQLHICFSRRILRPRGPAVFRMMCAVMLLTTILEPDGFFVGLSRILLFMLVVVMSTASIEAVSNGEAPTLRHPVAGGDRAASSVGAW